MNQLNNLKLCSEISCNYVYTPDNRESLCPRCNSEGIWLSTTSIGVNDDTEHYEHSNQPPNA